jgi:hypothetical protein
MNFKYIVRPSLYWCTVFTLIGAIGIVLFAKSRDVQLARSQIGKIILNLEHEIGEAQRHDQKLVAFMGSSLMHASIDTREFSNYGQWSDFQFVNLAQPSVGVWEILSVLRNCEQSLSSVAALVVDINPWSCNENALHPITKEKAAYPYEYPKWATFEERLDVPGYQNKLDLLCNYIPKYSVMRYPQFLLELNGSLPELDLPYYHGASEVVERLASAEAFMAKNISRNHMHDYQFSDRKAEQVRELKRLCARYGIKLIVLHPPLRESYYLYVDSSEKRSTEYGKYLNFLDAEMTTETVFSWKTPSECGLGESIFVDYGHMSKEGAVLYSRMLAKAFDEFGAL